MKYIVSGHSVLNLADGSNYTLTPGIHDGFSDEVKKHWAFSAYAKPLDESDLAKEVENLDLVARVKLLDDEITSLKAQVAEKDDEITSLKAQVAEKDDEITSLKAQVLSLTAESASESTSGETDEQPAEAEKVSANAKKQSTSNK
ncbi:STY1053 family phage-associated protein [Yersinia enterocolitica]|uniref:STY1053 family phage-associated protein n=1 Tax=Yersinia enterocolitica TaxID=630 RepID=UPI0030B5FE67